MCRLYGRNLRRDQPHEQSPNQPLWHNRSPRAAIDFEQRRTGNHEPKSVTVVLSEGTVVITLHEALSPAERVLARESGRKRRSGPGVSPTAVRYNSSDSLRQEIKRITGMEKCARRLAEIEPASGRALCRRSRPEPWCKSSNSPAACPQDTWSGKRARSHGREHETTRAVSIIAMQPLQGQYDAVQPHYSSSPPWRRITTITATARRRAEARYPRPSQSS